MTMPRMLGYVFNPVSFWFCRDRSGALRAVLCEVNNTFGESHCYLVHHDDLRPIEPDAWLDGRKAFHVSPFLPVEGGYRFRFRLDERTRPRGRELSRRPGPDAGHLGGRPARGPDGRRHRCGASSAARR